MEMSAEESSFPRLHLISHHFFPFYTSSKLSVGKSSSPSPSVDMVKSNSDSSLSSCRCWDLAVLLGNCTLDVHA
jgi:hypothetical protein